MTSQPIVLLTHRDAAAAIQPYMNVNAHWWLTDSRKRAVGYRPGPLPPAVANRCSGRVFYDRREIDRVIRDLTIGAGTRSALLPAHTSMSSGVVLPTLDKSEPAIQFRTDDGTLIIMRCANARAFIANAVPAIRMAEAWAESTPHSTAA